MTKNKQYRTVTITVIEQTVGDYLASGFKYAGQEVLAFAYGDDSWQTRQILANSPEKTYRELQEARGEHNNIANRGASEQELSEQYNLVQQAANKHQATSELSTSFKGAMAALAIVGLALGLKEAKDIFTTLGAKRTSHSGNNADVNSSKWFSDTHLKSIDIKGLTAKQVLHGSNGKVAIIGRSMGNSDRVGVRDYAAGLKEMDYDVEIFDNSIIPKNASDQFKELAAKAKEDYALGLRDDKYLSLNEVRKTKLFKANEGWADKLVKEGYTVIDIGNPHNLNSSAFYDLELKNIFGTH